MGTPTATPVVPATTPTATATACVLSFSDVPPGYWAYGYIQWAYCHNIVSGYAAWAYNYVETATAANIVAGYSCGGPGEPCPGRYYRPDRYATRAQLTKMLHQAFAVPGP